MMLRRILTCVTTWKLSKHGVLVIKCHDDSFPVIHRGKARTDVVDLELSREMISQSERWVKVILNQQSILHPIQKEKKSTHTSKGATGVTLACV